MNAYDARTIWLSWRSRRTPTIGVSPWVSSQCMLAARVEHVGDELELEPTRRMDRLVERGRVGRPTGVVLHRDIEADVPRALARAGEAGDDKRLVAVMQVLLDRLEEGAQLAIVVVRKVIAAAEIRSPVVDEAGGDPAAHGCR